MINSNYRPDIDGLRAISVIAVILYHFDFEFIKGGFLGVDIFFVISGFLITNILLEEIKKQNYNYIYFLLRRARRILPCLFMVISFTIFLSFFFMTPAYYTEFAKSAISSLIFVSNFFFWEQVNYFHELATFTPLLHTWSLSIEEQFYILYPFVIWFFYKNFEGKYLLLTLILILVASLFIASSFGSFTSKYFNNVEWKWLNPTSASFYFTPMRAWEIILGCIAALSFKKIIFRNFFTNILCLIAFANIIFSFIYFNKSSPLPSYLSLLPTISVLLIIIFNSKNNLTYRILSNKILVFIGLISYSLYLWHQPLIGYISQIRIQISLTEKIFFILLIFLISFFSWKYLETPFRDKKTIETKLFLKIIVCWGCFLLIISSIIIYKNGFLNNYPEEKRDMLKYTLDDYSDYVEENWTKLSNVNYLEEYAVVVVGDSFGQDFLNILLESKFIPEKKIATYYVNDFTYCDETINCISNKILNDLNNINADLIILAKNWNQDDYNFLDKQILKKINKRFRIVGNKNFGKVNIKQLSNLSKTQKKSYYNNIAFDQLEFNKYFKESLSNQFYFDFHQLLCTDIKCKLFTENGELISYDGLHLTKKGAQYISKKINWDVFFYK